MKIKIGKNYKTYGGWKALVIWEEISKKDGIYMGMKNFWAIHKPKSKDESPPILHFIDGKAQNTFSVEINMPPRYNEKHHPADIKEEWKGTFKKSLMDKYEGETIDSYLVDTGYVCAVILVGDNDIVLDSHPTFNWMIGKRLEDIKKWKKIKSIEHKYYDDINE